MGALLAILNVGANEAFKTLSSAVAKSHDGDTILVQAGTYTDDFVLITTKITIQGVGGIAKFKATKLAPNEKGVFVTNTDVTLANIEVSGARSSDKNGAAIRYQGGTLNLINVYAHDNEMGILANPVVDGKIYISNSEFGFNGSSTGLAHNIYIGEIDRFEIHDSYIHDAIVGHEIKSRAHNTVIANNVIADWNSKASYSIDIPQGGNAILVGNQIQQGPKSQNAAIIDFGGATSFPIYANSTLLAGNNTISNELTSSAARLLLNGSGVTGEFFGTKIYGLTASQLAVGSATFVDTTYLTSAPSISASKPAALPATGPLDASVTQASVTQASVLAQPANAAAFIAPPSSEMPDATRSLDNTFSAASAQKDLVPSASQRNDAPGGSSFSTDPTTGTYAAGPSFLDERVNNPVTGNWEN